MVRRFRDSSYRVSLLLALGLMGCSEPAPTESVATSAEQVINGTVANGVYSAVASRGGSGCSSVLVAPRVMLTSGHCILDHALNCETIDTIPLDVMFAEPGGGWADQTSFDARTVAVRALVHRPELFDMSQCPPSATYNCDTLIRLNLDHSKELIVLYLEDDAPSDVTPLPIMVAANVDTSHSAAEIGVFHDLEDWVMDEPNDPVVTTVGYGVGSHAYNVGANVRLGRDYGLTRWVNTQTNFAGYLGTDDCDNLASSSTEPGVVVSPGDLTMTQIGDPWTVPPGTSYPGVQHVHSGGGDSGGPVLVGAGAGAKGANTTPLPAPGFGDSYDPGKNYIVGTASLWVTSGDTPRTAFTPTFTQDAAMFLMDALNDSDSDGYADPVDDDSDNDGCDDDVDQHPDQGATEVGKIIHVNCSPSTSPWMLDEGVDSDGDGLKNCEDPNDDLDRIPDDEDMCPIHEGPFCFKFGQTCPWQPVFFDCVLAGCAEFLKLSHVVNPDPTRFVSFKVLSAAERVVVIAPAAGFSLEQSAAMLQGAMLRAPAALESARLAGRDQLEAERGDPLLLEVVGPDRRVRGSVAAYYPESVRVGSLRGANALELHFGIDGHAIEVLGTQFSPPR